MIEKAIENHVKATEQLDKEVELYKETLEKAKNSLEGGEKIQFENVQRDILTALRNVKKGGNVESIVKSLNQKYGT